MSFVIVWTCATEND